MQPAVHNTVLKYPASVTKKICEPKGSANHKTDFHHVTKWWIAFDQQTAPLSHPNFLSPLHFYVGSEIGPSPLEGSLLKNLTPTLPIFHHPYHFLLHSSPVIEINMNDIEAQIPSGPRLEEEPELDPQSAEGEEADAIESNFGEDKNHEKIEVLK